MKLPFFIASLVVGSASLCPCAAMASGVNHATKPTAVEFIHGQWPDVILRQSTPLQPNHNLSKLAFLVPDADEESVRTVLRPMPHTVKPPAGKEILEGAGVLNALLPSNQFTAPNPSHDPAIAVGNQYVLVINDHWISFYDRNGQLLPSKNGVPTSLSATDFFKTFWEPKLANGNQNLSNINLVSYLPTAILNPNPDGDMNQLGMINEWYDSRCAFDPIHKRFIFLSAARNQLWFNDPKGNPGGKYDLAVRRYFAIAVSRTEDPRDGFDMWMSTSSNYADWPRFSVSNNSITVAHNSPQAGHPYAYVISESDMLANKPHPANFEYYAKDFPGCRNVLPVTITGSSTLTYLTGVNNNGSDPARIFGFRPPASYAAPAPLLSGSVQLADGLGWQIDNPKWWNGFFYFCFNEQYVPDRMHVRVVRMPCGVDGNQLKPSNLPGLGYLDHAFGRSGPGDGPNDLVNYLYPSISVNNTGNCSIVYGRVGVQTAKPLYPEARYSLFKIHTLAPAPSSLIHKGEFFPPTPLNKRFDLVNSCVDPLDGETIWMCHTYAATAANDYNVVVSHVKP